MIQGQETETGRQRGDRGTERWKENEGQTDTDPFIFGSLLSPIALVEWDLCMILVGPLYPKIPHGRAWSGYFVSAAVNHTSCSEASPFQVILSLVESLWTWSCWKTSEAIGLPACLGET
jgi:hypothetical protein